MNNKITPNIMQVNFYYGMSGALKGTTISVRKTVKSKVISSNIKRWKSYSSLYTGDIRESDLVYAVLHLMSLSNETEYFDYNDWETSEHDQILIERGVTDPLFYHTVLKGYYLSDDQIKESIQKELDVYGSDEFEIRKILLVQQDKKFISERVLTEPTRSDWFTDVSDYLRCQEKYIEFTKAHNNITETIIIKDAKEYITETLRLDFFPSAN